MHQKVKYVEGISEKISPRLLRASHFTEGMKLPHGYQTPPRYVYDYEMEFYTQSEGSMFIENRLYPMKKGDIIFRKPEQLVYGIMPYNCYFIIFDLMDSTSKNASTYNFETEQEFQNIYINPIIDILPSVFTPTAPEKYHELFKGVFDESFSQKPTSPLMVKSYLLQILCSIYDEIQQSTIPQSPYYLTIKKVTKYIHHHLDKKITLHNLAELTQITPNHLHKVFKQTLGITPNDYIIQLRLDKAKKMLATTDIPVYEIALACGFNNIPYFSDRFKKQIGLSPRDFRKKYSYM